MSLNSSCVSSPFVLFARPDFQDLPMEVKGLVAHVLGAVPQRKAHDLHLGAIAKDVLEQALAFVSAALLDAITDAPQSPPSLSMNPDAIRKRRSRANHKSMASVRHACDMSQPSDESASISQPSACDTSQDPCLFVNRNLEIQTNNKRSEPSDVTPRVVPDLDTVREREVLDSLKSHELLASAATPQLARTIAQQAPDVDPVELATKLELQFRRRKPQKSVAGYILAVFRRQQEQQVQNTCLNNNIDKSTWENLPQRKAKTLPLPPRTFQKEDVLKPLSVERLPEVIRQEGLLAVGDILAGLRAVA